MEDLEVQEDNMFKKGQKIIVSNLKDFKDSQEVIFLAYIENAHEPFICVLDETKYTQGKKFSTWKFRFGKIIK